VARRLFLSALLLAVVGAALSASMVSASGGLLGGGGDGGGLLDGGGGGLLDGGGGGGGLLGGGGGGGLLDGGGGGGGGLLGGGGGGGLLGGGGSGGGGDILPPPPSTTPTPTPTPTDPTGSGGSGSSNYGQGGSAAPSNDGGRGSSGGGHGGSGRHGGAAGGPVGPHPPPPFRSNGMPTTSNPTTTLAPFGPAPLGVPNFVIDQFEIPPFLLPIYQACGTQYGIPWPVLAAINKIETAFGTNVNVSSAGAVGWMQFMPDTWRTWGVDATGDRKADPYNPVDAICSAARYLKKSGGQTDLRGAIFAYNHADWYVDEVLLYAKQYGSLPQDLVSSLTGLTAGDRFPVAANARYADSPSKGATDTRQRATDIYSRAGAPVIAVNDGTIKRIGDSKRLGNFLVLEDTYGNSFIYSQLGQIEKVHPVAKKRSGGKPAKAAGREASAKGAKGVFQHMRHQLTRIAGPADDHGPVNTEDSGRRLFAFPHREHNTEAAAAMGQLTGPISAPSYSPPASSGDAIVRYRPRKMELRPLRKGSQVTAGTLLGRVGKTDPKLAPHLSFGIRPAGKRSPRIDPKPILDGWKLLEATAIYRAAGQNPFQQSGPTNVSQDLLMPKAALEKRVLTDPRLEIYACGRNDVATGQIDQRVLAAMEYLADRGYRLTITSLKCGHSFLASSGNVSEHSTGDAMDIAAVNGIPIAGHQGPGSITAAVINDLLQLQGPMQPHQVISLMNMGGPSFAMADHWDHIHVGYYPHGTASPAKSGADLASLLRPRQWLELVGRLSQIRNPQVPTTPSTASLWVRLQERQGPKQAPSGE
jgi:hypothetical protein